MTINNKIVQIELYIPDGPKPHPLLLLLHGSAGVYTRNGSSAPIADNFGEKTFAQHCYVVALPHYLQAVGLQSIYSTTEIEKDFPLFLTTVHTILDSERSEPFVDSKFIGLYGESLGGFLAVAISMTDPTIGALSEYGAGLPPGVTFTVKNRLPALLQHGQLDNIVSVSQALALRHYLHSQGCPVRYIQYPSESHYFSTNGRKSLLLQTLTFFDQVFQPDISASLLPP
jgi:dipeptidyl aminopeptidase/acylaminoacyl peptidase